MCTAAIYRTDCFYFGRTLDHDVSYAEEVCVTPRNFALPFRKTHTAERHYAMIGMACVREGYPLYYDGMNEKGLCIAGLNFTGNARYGRERAGRINLAQFELIPYLLGGCASAAEAEATFRAVNLVSLPFGETLPAAQLHWLIADKKRTFTAEYGKEGLKIYENRIGVLTNNPPFEMQLSRLNDYRRLSPRPPRNTFGINGLKLYGMGMGTVGLPGGYTSPERFVRAAFVRANCASESGEAESVNGFFHILGSVGVPRGCCISGNGAEEYTLYSSCCNADRGIYYYTTYENHRICAVDLHAENAEGRALVRYPLIRREEIAYLNRAEKAARGSAPQEDG